MTKYLKCLCVVLMSCLLMSCGSASSIEDSFSVISELCKANFAPNTKEEYLEVFEKYKNTCIDEDTLAIFFDIGKEVHTNVTITNYNCIYIKSKSGNPEYQATMRVGNGEIYTDIRVRFIVREHKIVNVVIEANDNV